MNDIYTSNNSNIIYTNSLYKIEEPLTGSFNEIDTKAIDNDSVKSTSLKTKLLEKLRHKNSKNKTLTTRSIQTHDSNKPQSNNKAKKIKNRLTSIISNFKNRKNKDSIRSNEEPPATPKVRPYTSFYEGNLYLKNDAHLYDEPLYTIPFTQYKDTPKKSPVYIRKHNSEESIYVNSEVLRSNMPRKPSRQRFSQIL